MVAKRLFHICAWLLCVTLTACLTATAGAQAPAYLAQWVMHKAKAFLFVSAGIILLALACLALPPSARAEGGYVYITQWGTPGNGDGQFSLPPGVAADAAGNVYVADLYNHRIQKFSGAGTYLTQWGSQGSGNGQFDGPFGVATDAAGNVYVADYGNNRIQKFSDAGAYITQWGSQGSGNGRFDGPIGVATDAAGSVYVADFNNNRIQKFAPDPTAANASSWGSVKARYRQDGAAKQAQDR